MTPPSPPFYTRYGFSRIGADAMGLRIDPYPEICADGRLLRTILVSAVDLVASFFVREAAGTDVTMTSDLSLRAHASVGEEGPLEASGRLLRSGRRMVTTEVRIERGGTLLALGESTFVRSPRAAVQGQPAPSMDDLRVPPILERHPLIRPLAEEVGVLCDANRPGEAMLPLRPEVLNPEGVLQGALVGLLVESAALSLATSAAPADAAGGTGAGPFLEEIDLRYLAANRAGPISARASWIDAPSMMRVELRDAGQPSRITASAFVRTSSA